jgi:tyrosyl-tRNA synthetase
MAGTPGADPTKLSIEEQAAWLMEGTYFADEGGLADGADNGGGLREQMHAELRKKLERSVKTGEPLRVYYGADPTRKSLHIGHMVPIVHLRKFQRLGHQVTFLIGDYTALIGDPSGQSTERQQLTAAEVKAMSEFYTGQAHRLLHADTREVVYADGSVIEFCAEVVRNSSWLAKLSFSDIIELAAQFPLAQVTARKDFRERLDSGAGVRLHECMYMLMQGFDAYALNCDVQVGGYDQHFNLLAGRILQKHFAEKLKNSGSHFRYIGKPVRGPHVMLTYPLLMGTDGRKMSKSWGNTIDVLDPPEEMYGKLMRISDEMIAHYIDTAVEAAQAEKDEWKARAAEEPLAAKKWVAAQVTELYNGTEAALEAAEHFRRTVQEKSFSEDDIETVEVPVDFKAGGQRIADLLVAIGATPSKKEAMRLIEGGGVRLDDTSVADKFAEYQHTADAILRVGKRKIYRLT